MGGDFQTGRFLLLAMRKLTFTMIDADIFPEAQGVERTCVLPNLRSLREQLAGSSLDTI